MENPIRSVLTRRFWGLAAAGWTLLAFTNSAAVAADLVRAGREVSWPDLLGFYLAVYLPWFLITPVVFWWIERWPPTGVAWPRLLVRYLPMLVPWAFFYLPAQSAILSLSRHGSLDHFTETLRQMPLNQWVVDAVYLVALVGLAAASHQIRATRRREREATELAIANAGLEARLSAARLEMLRAQLEPHFLYNALNSIAGLVRQGQTDTAVEAVGLLSELLRYATRATDNDRVLLSEEVDFAEAYWGFQKLRYGQRLTCSYEIDPECGACQLPPLVLQPLLENAIRHGVETHEAPSRVALRVQRSRGQLEIAVSNRPGESRTGTPGLGVGLKNLRERLEWLYDPPVKPTLETNDGEFVARLLLPVEEAP